MPRHARDLFGGNVAPTATPRQTEKAHLRALVQRAGLRWWRPYLFHVAHERWSPKERAALRGCAVAKGLPDLWLMLPRPPHPFAVVELKAGADVQPEQEAWLLLLSACGAGIARPIRDWPDAFEALDTYAGARRRSDPPPPTVGALPALARHVAGDASALATAGASTRAPLPRGR